MFSFYSRKPNLLGIDISSSAIKLVEMSKKGREYRIESYAVAPLPDGVSNEKDISLARMCVSCLSRIRPKAPGGRVVENRQREDVFLDGRYLQGCFHNHQ